MTAVTHANFSTDGSLLLTPDKATLMKLIIDHEPVHQNVEPPGNKEQVIIVDAMPEVQAMKKRPTTTKLLHVKEQFVARVKSRIERSNYQEARVLFDD